MGPGFPLHIEQHVVSSTLTSAGGAGYHGSYDERTLHHTTVHFHVKSYFITRLRIHVLLREMGRFFRDHYATSAAPTELGGSGWCPDLSNSC
jgi:hypothetical protein